MHPTQARQTFQRNRFNHHARNSHSTQFFNLLTEPELLDQVETLLPAHRERLFPPTETLSMCCGRTPLETLLDGQSIWAEKNLAQI